MTDPATLIGDAIASVFAGDTPTLRTSYERWVHDGDAVGGIDLQRRPTVSIKNDASARMGANVEPKFVTIVESPVLYVGMGSGSGDQVINSQQFKPDRTGIILEYRYGVDREMREATPFMSSFGGNQKNLYTIDSFPVDEVEKNWQSTAPSSIRITGSEADALAARRTPASNNQDKIYEQKELAETIGPYRSHPQESKLRDIRYITMDVLPGVIYGTGTTTEQRRRLPSSGYQGSNYTAEDTEDAALFSINKTTGASTMIAAYNGTHWDDALIKQMHLISHHEGEGVLYGIMPPGSHQSFLDTAAANGDQHIGSLVSINKTTAEITDEGAIYWTPGTNGYDSVQIKCFTLDQGGGGGFKIILRTNNGSNPPAVNYSFQDFDHTIPAFSSEEMSFPDVSYTDADSKKEGLNIRSVSSRGVADQYYVIVSKGIGEMQNPKRYLYTVDVNDPLSFAEVGMIRQSSIENMVDELGTYYAVDSERHELVQVHENFLQSGVFQREMGAMVVDVFDTGATDAVVYTKLNIDNARAMHYHDLMVVTLEASDVGELLQIEFGNAVSKIDGRTPVFAEPGRQPDLQVQKVRFREADKQVDVYININGSTFQDPTRDEMRYIGFRVKNASKPFTFKVNRIQLMKMDPDPARSLLPPDDFLNSNKQFVQFNSQDIRQVRWFVQIRAILLTEVPPIAPRLKDAVSHSNHEVTVINHPHRRLRGGRMVTPHLNDATLEFMNAGYSQTPAKITGAYVSDGYGVDPSSEPILSPELFFGSGGAVVSTPTP